MRNRQPFHFFFPGRYFRQRVTVLPPVPAYMFHQVDAWDFEAMCRQIRFQKRATATFGDLLSGRSIAPDAVLLTYDDGWSSVWSMGLPLLRRYDLRITLFLPPLCVEDSEEIRPTLDDGVPAGELVERDLSARGRLTWGEVAALHASGHVEIQSHSLHHGVAFQSNELSGFVGPVSPFPLNGLAPLVLGGPAGDTVDFHPRPGTPLYAWGPALAISRRFVGSEAYAARCRQIVQEHGGAGFFSLPDWQAHLRAEASAYPPGTWESDEQRRQRYRLDLRESRRLIESRLPGTQVRVLAPPWAHMHEDLPVIARDVGFELLVMGYPFGIAQNAGPVPMYPRLFGDALWTYLDGPFLGGKRWLQARNKALRRRRAGAIP
jgi:hypothetical protein